MSEQVEPASVGREYAVVSDGHGLAPWARRLQLAGHSVSVYTTRPAYRHCWGSLLPVQLATRADKPGAWGPLGERIMSGAATLLTDSRRVIETFAGAPDVWGLADPTEDVADERPLGVMALWRIDHAVGHTLAVREWGAWAGGRGPRHIASAAFIGSVPLALQMAVDAAIKEGAPSGWQGLVFVVLRGEGGRLVPDGARYGWPAVLADLWLTRQADQGRDVLDAPAATGRAYMGIRVSLPPWPYYPTMANHQAEVRELALAGAAAHYVLHDVDVRGGKLYAGGSDGLVGVAVGDGHTLARAVRQAHVVAGAAACSDLTQWRADAGQVAGQALIELDVAGLLEG